MKYWKIIATVLLAMSCIFSALPTLAASQLTETPEQVEQALSGYDGTQALSWQDFWDHSTYIAGKNGSISRTEVTNGMGLFAQYLSYDLKAFGSTAGATDTQISLRDTAGNYGFKGNIEAGDVYLMHMIIRTTPDDASKPMKFHMSIYGEGSSSQYPATSGHPDDFFTLGQTDDLPTKWTEFYIPVQAHETYAPDKVLLFLNPKGGTGTVDLAYLEITNYGKSVSLEELPAATIDMTDYTLPGRTVLYWESFYNRATKSQTSPATMTLTKVSDGSGMFSHYLRADGTKTSGNYKHLQINYLDYGSPTTKPKGWELFGNAKAGDTVLIHMIARSDASDGEGSFRLAFYQQGVGSSDTSGTSAKLEKMTVGNLWTEFYIPVQTGSVDPSRASIFFGYEVQTLDIAMFEIIDYNDAAISTLPDSKTVIEAGYNEEYDFFQKFEGAESAIDIDGLTTAKKLTDSQSVSISDCECITSGDVALFSFAMKAETQSTPVTIKIGSTEMTYYVPVQWTRYYMPIKVNTLGSVTITGNVLLAEAKLVNKKSDSFESLALYSGPWLMEEFDDTVQYEESAVPTGGTKDLVKSGNFIYTIGDGNFTITDVTDPQYPVIRGSISDLGSAIRQISICKSGVDVFVTSRSNGCYIINVSDPDKPYVRSQYDSVEMATGLCVYQDYAFICNRQYGVEIVDISDLGNPRHVTNILTTGTVQSCEVLDGILYCGQWAQCCVSMYDITDTDNPKYINDVPLNGKGDGMFIDKVDGKTYLYAATGQHPLGVSDYGSQSDLKFGQGNGLDIVDITDPYNPVWLSTTNTDGRYYYANNDFWEVKVSQNNGRRYAYCMNTHNGVLVLDVTDPAAPVRLARYTIRVPNTSSNYKVLSFTGRETIVPYDTAAFMQDAIASIYVDDGIIYLAGSATGLYVVQNDQYLFEVSEPEVTVPIINGEGSYYDFDGSAYEGFKSYVNGYQFYAVAAYDDKLIAAAGSGGILVFDADSMTLLHTVETNGAAMDLAIYENKLYVAERTAGLGGYTIGDDGSLTEFMRYSGGQNAIRGVRLSPRGRFAVVMYSSNSTYVVDIQNPDAPTCVLKLSASSHLYHRNLAGPISDRYVVSWACGGNEYWIDFGEGDTLDAPVQMRKIEYSAADMRGSIVDLGDGTVLATRGNGYVMYDPEDTAVLPRNCTLYKVSGITMTGKAYLYGKNVLILSNRIDRTIQLIDISDRTAPRLLKQLKVNGNPDIAVVTGDYLYVPMGYQGLFRMKLSQFMNVQVAVGDRTTGYMSLQEAVDAAQGGYVKLMQNVTEDVEISDDVYLDLNGKTLTGTVSGEGTLYGMDSATDNYSVENMGRIEGSVTCNVVFHHKTNITGTIRRYMAIADNNGYTFHRFYLGITHINLKPGVTGIGYKAVFNGDAQVAEQIENCGFTLWVGEGKKHSVSKAFEHGKTVTLRLRNFDVKNYGEAQVHGAVFLTLKNGTVIESAETSYSLRGLLESIAANTDAYTASQLSAVRDMVQRFAEAMSGWNIDSLR